jgi:hypothetical protein
MEQECKQVYCLFISIVNHLLCLKALPFSQEMSIIKNVCRKGFRQSKPILLSIYITRYIFTKNFNIVTEEYVLNVQFVLRLKKKQFI